MSENPFLRNLIPHNARRKEFMPRVGQPITVYLPGEVVTAEVTREVSPASCLARIVSNPMGRNHQYKKNEEIAVMRGFDEFLGAERWEAVDTRALDMAEANLRFERAEKERIAREEAESKPQPMIEGPPPSDNWSA